MTLLRDQLKPLKQYYHTPWLSVILQLKEDLTENHSPKKKPRTRQHTPQKKISLNNLSTSHNNNLNILHFILTFCAKMNVSSWRKAADLIAQGTQATQQIQTAATADSNQLEKRVSYLAPVLAWQPMIAAHLR